MWLHTILIIYEDTKKLMKIFVVRSIIKKRVSAKLHQVAKYFAYCQFAEDAKRLRSVSEGSSFPLETRRFLRKAFRTFVRWTHITLFFRNFTRRRDKYSIQNYADFMFISVSCTWFLVLSLFLACLYLLLENVKAKLYCIDNVR